MGFIPFDDVLIRGKERGSERKGGGNDQAIGRVAVEVRQADAGGADGGGDGSKFHAGRDIGGDPSVEVGQEVQSVFGVEHADLPD